MEWELQCGNNGIRAARVFIGECAPVSDMGFQQKVWGTIGFGTVDTFGVVSKVNDTVLDSLEISRLVVMLVEHPVLPRCAWWSRERPRALIGLELTPVMSVLHKELHMLTDMNLYNDRRIVLNIVRQVLEIFTRKTKLMASLFKNYSDSLVLFHRLAMHVLYSFDLQRGHSRIGGGHVSLPLLLFLAPLGVCVELWFLDLFVTVVAAHCGWLAATHPEKVYYVLEEAWFRWTD